MLGPVGGQTRVRLGVDWGRRLLKEWVRRVGGDMVWRDLSDERMTDEDVVGPSAWFAVSTFDPGGATITFIGVVPEHRGHGYGHDLVQAATSAAHGRGFEAILSDVDTLNQPMIDTMRNARPSRRGAALAHLALPGRGGDTRRLLTPMAPTTQAPAHGVHVRF